jgi:hypothetical protein
MFNDHCRTVCRFRDQLTPIEYFEKNKDMLRKKGLTGRVLRDYIYTHTRECSSHNPLIIKFFIEKTRAKKVLDMSCGWGDRLIGSILAGVDLYYGTDPNTCLHDGYKKIVDVLAPISPNPNIKVVIKAVPFETHHIPDEYGQFDLMYTSPPYFDYEDYTKEKTQSISNFANREDLWLKNFVYVATRKIIDRIRMNGYIVFYFSQGYKNGYMEKFLKFMRYQPDIFYCGNIFFGVTKNKHKNHPIFIYKKSGKIPKQLSTKGLIVVDYPLRSDTSDDYGVGDKTVHVIRDDLLIGGTYLRILLEYVRSVLKNQSSKTELVLRGEHNKYLELGIVQALNLLKSQMELVIMDRDQNQSEEMIALQKNMYSLYPKIKYVKDEGVSRSSGLIVTLPNDDYMKYAKTALEKAIKDSEITPKRIWLTDYNHDLLEILFDIWPKTTFCVVIIDQIAKPIKSDRIIYFDAKRGAVNAPYPALKELDARIWEFQDDFVDDDYIWNTARKY